MTEEKVRSAKAKLAIKIIIKEVSIMFGFFLIIAIVAFIACVSSIDSKDIKIEAKTVNKIVDQTETESREKLPEFHSTMSRMITGNETAKGDRCIELEITAKKKIKKEKKRKREKRRRKINNIRKHYSSSNVEIMAHLIYGEAGDQSDACQQAVGMVVINRVNDKSFKSTTVKGVIFSPGQYACTWDGNFDREPSEQAYKNARAVLSGNTIIDVPENVVYQSQFEQGSGVWKKIGTETFCRK